MSKRLAKLLDEVAERRQHVTITRRDRPAAVLIAVAEYEALVDTIEVLSDDQTLALRDAGLLA